MPGQKKITSDPRVRDRLRLWSHGEEEPATSFMQARRNVMPHIKTFTRCGRGNSKMAQQVAWVLLTSSNISRSAWGALQKKGTQLFCCHWELGVLFTPRSLQAMRHRYSCSNITRRRLPVDLGLREKHKEAEEAEEEEEEEASTQESDPSPLVELRTTEVPDGDTASEASEEGRWCTVPLPFQVPPKPYLPHSVPWHSDGVFTGDPDRYGRTSLSDVSVHETVVSQLREIQRSFLSTQRDCP